TNTPDEFLAVCGVLGLGRLLAEGQRDLLPRLRGLARDPRWRTREGVAMALQRLGDADMAALLEAMEAWATDTPLVQRAAAAALCEPRLLRDPAHAARVLAVLDTITASIMQQRDRRGAAFVALRKGLGARKAEI
ncbi:MAG: HEAT repeat domain-containing protein, partial [Chloroflexales bacterium]